MKDLIFIYLSKNYGVDGSVYKYSRQLYPLDEDSLSRLAYDVRMIFSTNDFVTKYYTELWLKHEIKRRRQARQGFKIIEEHNF